MQHFQVFGIGVVARECVIELDVERHDFAAQSFKNLRSKSARRAVAARSHDFHLALEGRPVGEVGDVAFGEIVDEAIAAAVCVTKTPLKHDVAQSAHLVRAKGDGALRAHLYAGPAVVVVRGGHHGHCWHVEIKLREIGHRRHRKANVMHLDASRHKAGDERIFNRGRIGAIIVARRQLRLYAHFMQQRTKAKAQSLHAHQIDFFFKQPACVIFAKARRLDHRSGFIGIGVGDEVRNGLGIGVRRHGRPRFEGAFIIVRFRACVSGTQARRNKGGAYGFRMRLPRATSKPPSLLRKLMPRRLTLEAPRGNTMACTS